MSRIEVDSRVLAVALRYAYPRETGMIDLIVDELERKIDEIEDWIIRQMIEDAKYHLAIDLRKGTDDKIVNRNYAIGVIDLCNERLLGGKKCQEKKTAL